MSITKGERYVNGYRSIRENAQGRGDTRTGSSWRSVRATATAMMLAIDITCRNVASNYPQPRNVRRNLENASLTALKMMGCEHGRSKKRPSCASVSEMNTSFLCRIQRRSSRYLVYSQCSNTCQMTVVGQKKRRLICTPT